MKKAAKQAVKGLSNSSKGIRGESFTSTEQQTPVACAGDSCTVWVWKLAAAASFHRAFPVGVALLFQEFTALFSGYLLFIWKVAKQTKGWAHEKDAKGTWTLALIYRLEAEFQTGIQMRNLFRDLRTQGNGNACFLAMLRPQQKQLLDPFGGTASVDGAVVLSGRGQMKLFFEWLAGLLVWTSNCSLSCDIGYKTGNILQLVQCESYFFQAWQPVVSLWKLMVGFIFLYCTGANIFTRWTVWTKCARW